jgi:hypothetical protein
MFIILPTKSVFYFLILSFGGAAGRQSSLYVSVSLGGYESDIFVSGLLQVTVPSNVVMNLLFPTVRVILWASRGNITFLRGTSLCLEFRIC